MLLHGRPQRNTIRCMPILSIIQEIQDNRMMMPFCICRNLHLVGRIAYPQPQLLHWSPPTCTASRARTRGDSQQQTCTYTAQPPHWPPAVLLPPSSCAVHAPSTPAACLSRACQRGSAPACQDLYDCTFPERNILCWLPKVVLSGGPVEIRDSQTTSVKG